MKVGLARGIVQFVIAAVALWAFSLFIPGFSHLNLVNTVIVAAIIAVIGVLLTEMPGTLVSASGRGVIEFLATAGVLSIYYTLLPYHVAHPYAYIESALAVGIVTGIVEYIISPHKVVAH